MKNSNIKEALYKTLELLNSDGEIKEANIELCIDYDAYLDSPEVRLIVGSDGYCRYGIMKTFSFVENGESIYDTYKRFIFDRVPERIDEVWLLEHGFLPY